jgi:hypothetical protein
VNKKSTAFCAGDFELRQMDVYRYSSVGRSLTGVESEFYDRIAVDSARLSNFFGRDETHRVRDDPSLEA